MIKANVTYDINKTEDKNSIISHFLIFKVFEILAESSSITHQIKIIAR